MTREEAINKLHGLIYGVVDRQRIDDTCREVIDYLKAQEPVKPTIDIRHGKSMWRCGSCSTALQPNQMHAKFCFNCGRKVKWE